MWPAVAAGLRRPQRSRHRTTFDGVTLRPLVGVQARPRIMAEAARAGNGRGARFSGGNRTAAAARRLRHRRDHVPKYSARPNASGRSKPPARRAVPCGWISGRRSRPSRPRSRCDRALRSVRYARPWRRPAGGEALRARRSTIIAQPSTATPQRDSGGAATLPGNARSLDSAASCSSGCSDRARRGRFSAFRSTSRPRAHWWLSRARLALEEAPHGITINVVSPGDIRDKSHRPRAGARALDANNPRGRPGSPRTSPMPCDS